MDKQPAFACHFPNEDVWGGHDAVAQILLEAQADVNKGKKDKTSPLYIASQNGHTSLVKLLLDANASVNAQNDSMATALFISSQSLGCSFQNQQLHQNLFKSTYQKMSDSPEATPTGEVIVMVFEFFLSTWSVQLQVTFFCYTMMTLEHMADWTEERLWRHCEHVAFKKCWLFAKD